MTRVLVFGTFDIFHKGHESLFKQARRFGDELFVVIALDKTVEKVKGRAPIHAQQERLDVVAAHPLVTKALLGNPGDKYRVIEASKPDVICLGYDQDAFTAELSENLEKRGLRPQIVRLKPFHPEKYKSSLLSKKR